MRPVASMAGAGVLQEECLPGQTPSKLLQLVCHLQLTLYSTSAQSGGSSMLARHTWPSVHCRGSASSMLHEPMVGWLPTSTTS